MPFLERKYDYAKVWRPNGTPWAEGEPAEWAFQDALDSHAVQLAVERALTAFEREFGRFPKRDMLVVEIIGGHRGPQAVIYELPEA